MTYNKFIPKFSFETNTRILQLSYSSEPTNQVRAAAEISAGKPPPPRVFYSQLYI